MLQASVRKYGFGLLFSIGMLFSIDLFSQCGYKSLSIEERAVQSSHIVTGEIVDQFALWDELGEHIYTYYEIAVYSFLGDGELNSILLKTKGGRIGDQVEWVHPSLHFQLGQKGVFLINESSDSELEGELVFEAGFGEQSFLALDDKQLQVQDFSSSEVFSHSLLMEELSSLKSADVNIIQELSLQENKMVPPVIDNITPNSVPAGDLQTLFILGNNFGDAPTGSATVQFLNPDFFGNVIAYLDVPPNHIVGWSNTQIEVIVPGRDVGLNFPGAGRGPIRVVNPQGEVTESDETLEIPFNKMIYGFEALRLVDQNGFGGYTFSYNSELNNAAAIAAIERGVETWRCGIQSSFTLSGQSSSVSCAVKDGVNIISFDDNCALATGQLSQATHWIELCDDQAFVQEVDIIFNDDFNWNYGPDATQNGERDFETTIVHEFGHAHGLAHVLNVEETMYPSQATGFDNRAIDQDANFCGDLIISESSETLDCGEELGIIPISACEENCSLSLSGNVNSTCSSEEKVTILLSLSDVNGSSSGFQVLVDDEIVEAVLFYNPLGQTVFELELLADGQTHDFAVQDISDNNCFDDFTLELPNCICEINADINPLSSCENGEITYGIQLSNENTSSAYNVFLDEDLFLEEQAYDQDGNTLLQINLIGDDSSHLLLIQDSENSNCQEIINVETQDCSCSLTVDLLEQEVCDENGFTNLSFELVSINESDEGFSVYNNGELISPNNSYEAASTFFDYALSADGSTQVFQFVDNLDNSCIAEVEFDLIDCICALNVEYTALGECTENNTLFYSLNISSNGSSEFFDVWSNGELIAGSPFIYDADLETEVIIELLANGTEYEIQVIDAFFDCENAVLITSPICNFIPPCELEVNHSLVTPCGNFNQSIYEIALINGSPNSEGVSVSLNGEAIAGSPFNYDSSGELAFEYSFLANGSLAIFEFVDLLDPSCSVSENILLEDCKCNMNLLEVQFSDCTEANDLTATILFSTEALGAQGCSLFVDGELAGTFDYLDIATQEVECSITGDGQIHEFLIVDQEDPSCTLSFSESIPNCSACSILAEITALSDCSDGSFITYSLSVESDQIGGFDLLINAAPFNELGFVYDPSGVTFVPLQFAGTGETFTYEVVDDEDPNCRSGGSFDLPDCIVDPPCNLSLDLLALDFCNDDSTAIALTITDENGSANGFSLRLDGTILEGDFFYESNGLTSLQIPVLGDGNEHMVSVQDLGDNACNEVGMVSVLSCQKATECRIEIVQWVVHDCTEDVQVVDVQVFVQGLNETGFFVYVNGIAQSEEPLLVSGERILSIPVECESQVVQLDLIPVDDLNCGESASIGIGDGLQVFPNPVNDLTDVLTISGIQPQDVGQNLLWELYDASGKLVEAQTVLGSASIEIQFWESLATGIYVFRLSSSVNSYEHKILASR